MNSNKKIVIKIIEYLLLSITLYVIGKYFFENISELKNYKFSFNLYIFSLSIICSWIWMIINSIVYNQLIKSIDKNTNFFENFRIWTNSYLGRYIPGKVGIVASRIYFHKQKGLDPKKVTFVFYIESILSLLSSLVIFFISTLFYEFPLFSQYKYLSILFIILLTISIHPRLLGLGINKILSLLKKERTIVNIDMTYFFYIKIVFINLIKWSFAGLGVFLLINSITPFSITNFPLVIGTYSLAAVIGYFAFFAPSGIGVVEGIIVYSFKTVLAGSFAVIISILIRVWKIIGELSFIGLVNIYQLFRIKKNEK